VSLLGDVLFQLIGEGAVEALRRKRGTPPAPWHDESRSSLGAVAAFGGTIGTLFSLVALSGLLFEISFRDMGAIFLLGCSLGSLAVCWGSLRAGLRAPEVTSRNLGLAAYGKWAAVPGLVVSGADVLLWLVRVIQWH
jgi:hypothetical protein